MCVLASGIHEMREMVLPSTDARLQQGAASPVLSRCGVPLRVLRTGATTGDNQLATYLMVSADSGFAPPPWQARVGPVLLYRADGLPVSKQHVLLLWNYFNVLMDAFGNADGSSGGARLQRVWMSPAAFSCKIAGLGAPRGAAF